MRVASSDRRVRFVSAGAGLVALSIAAAVAFANRPVLAQTGAPDVAPVATAKPASVVKTEATSFDLWTVVCNTLSSPPRAKRCLARLAVNSEKTHQPIVNLIVGPNAKGEMRLDVQIPTSTSIPEGVTLSFEDGAQVKIPIALCDPSSCIASLPYNARMLGLLANVKVAVSWVSLAAGSVKVEFPLTGAKAALTSLTDVMAGGSAAAPLRN